MGRRRFLLLAALVVAAGTALQLPTLDIGFFVDDYVHQLVLAGHAPLGSPLQPSSLYDFGEADAWRNLEDPIWSPIWWTSPDWKIRFFRPLSSLSLRIDHWTWSESPLGYHVMSLGWYVVALVLVLSLYRSIGFERGAALAALALWATTNCGALPVGWIANRNTLLATIATVAAALAVIRMRNRWRVPVALVAAGVAVGCKESGVAAFVLVGGWLALEAARTDGTDRRRALVGATVAATLGVLYLVALAGAGFGTRSGFYATPWSEPGRYGGHVLTLFTAGLLRLIAPVTLEIGSMNPGVVLPMMAVGALVSWPIWFAITRAVRRHSALPFLGLWTVTGLCVEGAPLAQDRLLFQAAIGSAGILGLFVWRRLHHRQEAPTRRLTRVAAWAVVAVSGICCGLFSLFQARIIAELSGQLRQAVVSVDPGPADGLPVDALVLQAGNRTLVFSLAATWRIESPRDDVRFSIIQMGSQALAWQRTGPRSCTLRSLGGPMLTHPFETVYLSGREPPRTGDGGSIAIGRIEVLESDASGPIVLGLEFDRELEDAHLRFLVPVPGRALGVVDPPAIGETLMLPAVGPTLSMLP